MVGSNRRVKVIGQWRCCRHIINTRREMCRRNRVFGHPCIKVGSKNISMVETEHQESCQAKNNNSDKRVLIRIIKTRGLSHINRRLFNLNTILWFMREKVKDLTLLSLHRVSNPKESWLNLNFRQSRHQFLKTFIIIRGHHIACMFHSLSNQIAKCVIHAQLTWGTLIIVSDIQFFTLRMYQLSSKLVKANWLRTVNIWDLKSKSSANRHNQSTKVLAAAIKD